MYLICFPVSTKVTSSVLHAAALQYKSVYSAPLLFPVLDINLVLVNVIDLL